MASNIDPITRPSERRVNRDFTPLPGRKDDVTTNNNISKSLNVLAMTVQYCTVQYTVLYGDSVNMILRNDGTRRSYGEFPKFRGDDTTEQGQWPRHVNFAEASNEQPASSQATTAFLGDCIVVVIIFSWEGSCSELSRDAVIRVVQILYLLANASASMRSESSSSFPMALLGLVVFWASLLASPWPSTSSTTAAAAAFVPADLSHRERRILMVPSRSDLRVATSADKIVDTPPSSSSGGESGSEVVFPPPLSPIDRVARAATFWGTAVPIVAQYYGLISKIKLKEVLGSSLSQDQVESMWAAQHEDGATKLAAAVTHLKGFYVKTAQIVSTRQDLFPEQYTEALKGFTDNLDPMPGYDTPCFS